MKILNISVLLAGALVCSCTTHKPPPVGQPVAYLKFTDEMMRSLFLTRKSGVEISQDGCKSTQVVVTDDWIAVPANQDLIFSHFLDTRGGTLVAIQCGVWGKLTLEAGQRVQSNYFIDFQRNACGTVLTDLTNGTPGTRIALRKYDGKCPK